jgi:hypothetical protein
MFLKKDWKRRTGKDGLEKTDWKRRTGKDGLEKGFCQQTFRSELR